LCPVFSPEKFSLQFPKKRNPTKVQRKCTPSFCFSSPSTPPCVTTTIPFHLELPEFLHPFHLLSLTFLSLFSRKKEKIRSPERKGFSPSKDRKIVSFFLISSFLISPLLVRSYIEIRKRKKFIFSLYMSS